MMRHEDPSKLGVARRRAVLGWLIGQGMTNEAADSWCAAWEAEATRQGRQLRALDYREGAGLWIAERLRSRPSP